jgi:DNA mismatch repair ATPase MutS
MHRDRDFNPARNGVWNAAALSQDLALDTLWKAMAGDDPFLAGVARDALLNGLYNDEGTILYRQAVLRDCLGNPAVVRRLYDLAVEAIEKEKKVGYFGRVSHYPASILSSSIDTLQMFVVMLSTLRNIARDQVDRFESDAFANLFEMLKKELDEAYLAHIQALLAELKLKGGVLLSAELGQGNRCTNFVLRQAEEAPRWWQRMLDLHSSDYSFHIDERDESGAEILSKISDSGINNVANALAQSTDHILSFFRMLRTELAFYIGCLNLHERLAALAAPVCFPQPFPVGSRRQRFRTLYDVCLALQMEQAVTGNDVDADGKDLIVITGANQGGKSSLLRGVGLAQAMMQCGMFVAAESFEAALCSGLFTHYKREEDATMKSGKFNEELARMSDIADHLAPNGLLLFNESFAATNEREGAAIADQVVRALLERRIKIFFVTHSYAFAHGLFDQHGGEVLFLRAERLEDGTRTFRLVEGEPLETSHGEDLYRRIFGNDKDGANT